MQIRWLLPVLFSIISMASHAQVKSSVYFAFNRYELSAGARQTLDSIAAYATSIDSIQLYAHCDSVSNNAINDRLSEQRADVVKSYLMRHGVRATLIRKVKGYGKRKPAYDNGTDANRALNRRTEIWYYLHPIQNAVIKKQEVVEETREKVIVPRPWSTFMEEIKVGQSFTLKNLNFYGGRHRVLPSSQQVLDSLVSMLTAYAAVEVEVQGYVCCMPIGKDGLDHDTNTQALSVNRAKAVYEYLVAHGIAESRLSYKGYGSKPIVAEITEEDKTTNRRVEIKVLKK